MISHKMQLKKMREEKKCNQSKYNQQIAHIKGSNCFGFVSIWTQSNQPNAYMCVFFVRLILWLCIASQLNVRLIFRLWLFTPFGKKKNYNNSHDECTINLMDNFHLRQKLTKPFQQQQQQTVNSKSSFIFLCRL